MPPTSSSLHYLTYLAIGHEGGTLIEWGRERERDRKKRYLESSSLLVGVRGTVNWLRRAGIGGRERRLRLELIGRHASKQDVDPFDHGE